MNNVLALQPLNIAMIVIWTIFVIAAIIIEFETANLVSIWFAAGGIASIVCAVLELPIWIQIIVFAVVSGIFLLATRPFVNKFVNKKPSIVTNAFNIIGKKAVVIEDIDPVNSKGLVKIGTEVWSAESETNEKISKDTEVEVTAINGVKAVVKSK